MSAARPSFDATRAALRQAADGVADLLSRARDPNARVPGMDWTVADVALHLALVGEHYTGYAQGSTEPFVDVSDIPGGSVARTNAARLAADRDRDLAVLAKRVRAGAASLVDATEHRAPTDPVMWNGQPLELTQMLGLGLGEYIVHGLDIARALSAHWTIVPEDARIVFASALPVFPLLVDRQKASSVTATYDLRVRGGVRVEICLDHGAATVGAPTGPFDCHVSAEPVALLLVAYGRRSQWPAALTGKLLAWGKKPWLGLRFTQYFVAP